MLRKVTGPRGDEVTGYWRKLHNDELFDLYLSSKIINVIHLRGERWAGHVPHVEEGRDGQDVCHIWRRGEMHTEFWCRSLRERDYLEKLDIVVRPLINGLVGFIWFKVVSSGGWPITW